MRPLSPGPFVARFLIRLVVPVGVIALS
jgi:hypothetical protein